MQNQIAVIALLLFLCQAWPASAAGLPELLRLARQEMAPFDCTFDGFYPIANCSQSFYSCVDGVMYPQTCSGNSVFDPSTSQCLSPEYVAGCQSANTATTSTTTQMTPPPINCTDDGFYSLAPCSTVYIACVGGVAYLQECPPGSVYVGEEKRCRQRQDTDCDSTASPTTSTSTTPRITSTTTETTPSAARTTTATTPTTTATTPTTAATTPTTTPSTATTTPTTTTSTTTPTTTTPTTTTTRTTTTTPTTTTPTTTTPTTTPTTTVPYIFTCPSQYGYYPLYPGACTEKYYSCWEGKHYLQTCPNGNLFDETIQNSGGLPGFQTGACTSPNLAACNKP